MPKFLQDDLKLFNGIVSDLFPKTREEPIDYGTLEDSIRNVCRNKCLKDVDGKRFGFGQKLFVPPDRPNLFPDTFATGLLFCRLYYKDYSAV